MQLIRLNRTDNRPIAFYGKEIAYETDKKDESIRWTNIRVYIRDKSDYVVGIARLTCFIGERDYLTAEQLKTINDIVLYIKTEVSNPFTYEEEVAKGQFKEIGPWPACPDVERSIAIQLDERKPTAVGKQG